MESREAGFLIGAGVGASVSLLQATGQGLAAARQHQRDVSTIQRWSLALDRERQARVAAQRENARLIAENRALQIALRNSQFELEILRNA